MVLHWYCKRVNVTMGQRNNLRDFIFKHNKSARSRKKFLEEATAANCFIDNKGWGWCTLNTIAEKEFIHFGKHNSIILLILFLFSLSP
jgi:hypothetical protein